MRRPSRPYERNRVGKLLRVDIKERGTLSGGSPEASPSKLVRTTLGLSQGHVR